MQIPNYQEWDQTLARWENRANKFDWIPFVHFCSGAARTVAAQVQIIAGVALAGLQVFKRNAREASKGIDYALHGVANLMRGSIAMIPFGNLALLFYDNCMGRCHYPLEGRALKLGTT